MSHVAVAPAARLNAVLAVGVFALHFAMLFAIPVAVHADAAWGLALVPIVLVTNAFWSLVHEAIHGMLFRQRRINDAVGRAFGVCFGAPFRALRAGHLLHHRFSRTARERTEVYEPGRTMRLVASLRYYLQIFGGVYLLEVFGALAAFLPARALAAIERRLESSGSVSQLVLRVLRQPAALRELRVDAAAMLLLYSTSFALYGEHWWMLAAAIAGRAFLISFADNAYHYGTRLDAPREAKNVRAPRWLEAGLLNFTLHGIHHQHPSLPWHALHARFEVGGGRYDEGYFACLVRQLEGPIPVSRLAT